MTRKYMQYLFLSSWVWKPYSLLWLWIAFFIKGIVFWSLHLISSSLLQSLIHVLWFFTKGIKLSYINVYHGFKSFSTPATKWFFTRKCYLIWFFTKLSFVGTKRTTTASFSHTMVMIYYLYLHTTKLITFRV